MVSIILPCYKAERFLSNIVHDIFSQTYKDWQLIAVSNGQGQEPQLQLLRQLQQEAPEPDKFIILSEEQGNVSNARNVGMDHATGEWLTFVDADDRVDPNHLQLLVGATLTGNPDIIVCGYTSVDPKWRRTAHIQPCEQEKMISKRELMEETMPTPSNPPTPLRGIIDTVWNQMIRTALIKEHNIRYDVNFRNHEDCIFMRHCVVATNHIKLIPMSGYKYWYVNAESAITKYDPDRIAAQEAANALDIQIMQQAGTPESTIAAARIRDKYYNARQALNNLFLPGTPFTTFGSKVREVRRLIFDDPEARAAIEAQDRHAHALFDRLLGFDLAYRLRSPRYMVFQRQFLAPIIVAYRLHIRERFFPPKD